MILKADGGMEDIRHKGVLPLKRVREIIGGEIEWVPFADGAVAAVRKDKTGLPANKHYPSLSGDIVLGKMPKDEFVGALGVAIG